MKQCTSCKEIMPLEEFYRTPQGKDGRDSRCKKCQYARQTELRRTKKYKAMEKREELDVLGFDVDGNGRPYAYPSLGLYPSRERSDIRSRRTMEEGMELLDWALARSGRSLD